MTSEEASYIPTVVIVGGGISGLTTGLCLAHLIPGTKPLILEQHARLTSLGGPIAIPPNGTRVFKSIGLLDSLMAVGDGCSVRHLVRGDSGEVLREDVADAADKAPYLLAMRGDLLSWLDDQFRQRGGTTRFGSTVTELDEQEDGVRVRTAQGDVWTVDLAVAADGVRSSLRPGIIHDVRARVASSSTISVTGCDIPCSLVLRDPLLAELYRRPGPTIWVGPERYMVTAAMPRHGLFWALFCDVGEEVAAHEDWAVAGDLDHVRERFGAFVGGGASRIIEAAVAARGTPGRQCVKWTTACVGPLTGWRSPRGRVVLLGDAAHAMLPDGGQGATQCIESALSLALFCRAARCASDIPLATLRHERFRKPRVDRVQRLGQTNATSFRLRAPEDDGGEAGHETALKLWDEQFGWLSQYDVFQEVSEYLEQLHLEEPKH